MNISWIRFKSLVTGRRYIIFNGESTSHRVQTLNGRDIVFLRHRSHYLDSLTNYQNIKPFTWSYIIGFTADEVPEKMEDA